MYLPGSWTRFVLSLRSPSKVLLQQWRHLPNNWVLKFYIYMCAHTHIYTHIPIFWSYILPGRSVAGCGTSQAHSWYLLQSVLLRPAFSWCLSFPYRRWCLEAFSLMLILWTGRVCHGGILGLWYWAVCMNKVAAEVFTSLSSCKGKFQQIFHLSGSVVTWPDVTQLWSLWHRATHPVSTCMELRWVCHCFSVCRSSGPPAPATLPGLCTVCVIGLVLTISSSFPPLSTLQYHTTNLESISGQISITFPQRECALYT